MPGVKTTTGVRAGNGTPLRVTASQAFVVGLCERGPTTPTLVESMLDHQLVHGLKFSSGFVYDELDSAFAEGLTRAYVLRVVGPAATKGTLTLVDTAGVPAPTVRLDAKDPGAWSSDVTVVITAGTLANTFTLTLTHKAGKPAQRQEIYRNLANPAALVTAITARPSAFVTATNLGSLTAAPGNNPAILASTPLSAGTDDLAAVTFATLVSAAATIPRALGPGAITIPGYPAGDIGPGLLAACRGKLRVCPMHVDRADSTSLVKADAGALAAEVEPEHGAIFYPWAKVPDVGGGNRAIPPTGYVLGKRARAYQQVGATKPAAGAIARADYIVAPDVELDSTTGDDLNTNNVNAIRTIQYGANISTRIYGYRSLSTDEDNWYFLTQRDALNAIVWGIEEAIEEALFDRIDSRNKLVTRITSLCEGIVEDFRQNLDLYERRVNGELIDPGYSINVTVEPAAKSATVRLGVRLSEAAETFFVLITKSAVDLPV